MFDHLRFYISFGFSLFPCHAQGEKAKAPLTVHGFQDASLDWQQVEAWYKQFPGCAWATPTSADRGVLDIDPRNGGDAALARLIAEHGPLPLTPKVKTGGGGVHYWLKFSPGTKSGKVADGIDRKAAFGYVILPPSRIAIPEHEGRAYIWEVKPWETPIADAPAWLLAKSKALAKGLADAEPWVVQEAGEDLLTHPGCSKGKRTPTLWQLVGVHLARGDSPATIYALAEAWANRCNPPLEDWQKHVDGLIEKEKAKALKRTPTHTATTINISKELINSPDELISSFASAQNAGAVVGGVSYEALTNKLETLALAETLAKASQQKAKTEALGLVSVLPETNVEPNVKPNVEPNAFPQLSAEAYHGLFGQMLKAVEPQTEASSAGILLGWLTCFGNIVGRGASFWVGPRLHYPILFVGVVGKTSDAKGDSWAVAVYPFKQVEPEWASICIANGVGSGEGLIERVADEQMFMGKDGKAQVIPGAEDKRCLLRLSELGQCFRRGRRENATLYDHLLTAWDGDPMHIPNRKGNALSASDYTISLVGDITPGMLQKLLETGTEGFNGFANRFLWVAVRRSRFLPSGGNMAILEPFFKPLAEALAFAKTAGELKRDAEAERLWEEVYPSLCLSGDSVPHTDRGAPYTVRLSMLFALADKSRIIKLEHLRAALAVWDYCRQSARLIFGQTAVTEADPLWLRLLDAISKAPGISRSGLHEAFGNRLKAEAMADALAHLESSGLAYKRMVQAEGAGRPAECWYPGREPEGEGEGKRDKADTHTPPPQNETCERTNYFPPAEGEGISSQGRPCERINSPPAEGELISSLASATPEQEAPAQGVDAGEVLVGVSLQPGPNPEKLAPNAEAPAAPTPPPKLWFPDGTPPMSFAELLGHVQSRGLRFRTAWRPDLGTGDPDGDDCFVLVEGCPELDALCIHYQTQLQEVVPSDLDDCLRSAFEFYSKEDSNTQADAPG